MSILKKFICMESVNGCEGQGLYQKNAGKMPGIRGMMTREGDRTLIHLFRDKANESTFVHELGHVFLEDLRTLAALENAPEQVKKVGAGIAPLFL